ncbi:MAG: efflux RND transporter permease subunit, partial [Pseudomonadota bacterium]
FIINPDGEGRQSYAALRSTLITLPPNVRSSRAFDEISLSALGDLDIAPSAPRITRFQGERINQILGYVSTDALPSTAVVAFEAAVADGRFNLPPGYDYSFGGDAEARSDAVGNLLAQVGIIIVATIGVLVLTFRSFRLGTIVLVVAGLSMGLGMLALAAFGYPFGFQPIIALIGLTGVAINAAIIIMSGLQGDPAALAGDRDAVVDGVMETARHITSTTLTTFAGFLPLILSEGEFWPGFATTVAGGVLLSTIISFFFVPQIFLILTGIRPFQPRKREEDLAGPIVSSAPMAGSVA